MEILVIDVGGSHVKFRVWGCQHDEKFSSRDHPTAKRTVKRVLAATRDWKYSAVSVGIPGTVIRGRIARTSKHLGRGWVGFDFEKYFGKPVKVINDAAMQALGSYRGGRMLFLGLGTGLGSTLILDEVVVPLELGRLRYLKKKTIGDVLGRKGLKEAGQTKWEKSVHEVVANLADAFQTDYVVIGGGNVKSLRRLPPGAHRGDNDNAFAGGARLWGCDGVHAHARKHTWVIA